jgi:hypothetical protein
MILVSSIFLYLHRYNSQPLLRNVYLITIVQQDPDQALATADHCPKLPAEINLDNDFMFILKSHAAPSFVSLLHKLDLSLKTHQDKG